MILLIFAQKKFNREEEPWKLSDSSAKNNDYKQLGVQQRFSCSGVVIDDIWNGSRTIN